VLAAGIHHNYESTTVNKNSPPRVDQLWQHVFCQFGVADNGILSALFELGTVGGSGPSSGLGGMNGINEAGGASGNGTAAEASV